MTTKRILVRGLVQGVCFRISTVEKACSLGLAGRVRNLPDGRVEILAEGPAPLVEELVAWARSGPPGSRVDELSAQAVSPGGWLDFRITS